MAIFTTTTALNSSTINLFIALNSLSAQTYSAIAGGFRVTVSPTETVDFFGTFTLVGGVPATGTITAITRSVNAAAVQTLSGISVSLATAIANASNPIAGLTPSGLFTGDDTITGSAFADSLAGFNGKDTIDGGAGLDTVLFTEKNTSVVLTLNGANNATAKVGGIDEDTLKNIENVVGGGGNDTITGDSLANVLNGGGGNDTLKGAGGNDTLDGGTGVDTADFSDKTLAVSVTLNAAATAVVKVNGVTEDSVVNIENVIGGSGNDTLTGDYLANLLDGGAGDDTLKGLGGKDVLDGGAGTGDTADFSDKTLSVVLTLNGATDATVTVGGLVEDTVRNIENVIGGSGADTITGDSKANRIEGGLGDDEIFATAGGDIIDGQGGFDEADYSFINESVVVTLNGAGPAIVKVGGVDRDTLYNIEGVVGGQVDDILTGDSLNNGFNGNLGNDTIDGGAGVDTANYEERSGSVVVTLNGSTFVTVKVGGVDEDSIRNIEGIGGGTGNDILTGDSLANQLFGFSGDDILDGRGGFDFLDGEAGSDTATYADRTDAVSVVLKGATSTTVFIGGLAEDTIRNIENIIGGSGDDQLTGNNGQNTLSGGGGDDLLIGGIGADVLDGGIGTDTASYADQSAVVEVTLNGASNATVKVGGADQDTVRNIENLIGGKTDDLLTGDGGVNLIEGVGGNDTLRGGAGQDTLDGGVGSDTAMYDDATLSVVVTLNNPLDSVVTIGGVDEDTLRSIENVVGGSANDTLTGDALANRLMGGDGIDTLDGGAGFDTVDFSDKLLAVELTLTRHTVAIAKVGGVNEDNVKNFENARGGAGNDIITGDSLANVLTGNQGDDILSGGGLNDTLVGGEGNDILDGGAFNDSAMYTEKTVAVVVELDGAADATVTVGGVAEDTVRNVENIFSGSGNDILTGDAFVNFFDGGAGNDILTGALGKDVLEGGAGSDTASYAEKTLAVAVTLNRFSDATVTVGGVAEDTIRNIENIIGGSGNDTLVGDLLANRLEGGDGDDTLRGAGGADYLDGGAGVDKADYTDQTLSVSIALDGDTESSVFINGVLEDTLRRIENVTGGKGNDFIAGDDSANWLIGNVGNDTLSGGLGADILDGGSGNDAADYSDRTVSVVATLTGATDATVTVGGLAEDTIRNIESLIGGSAADTLTGDGQVNWLEGGLGADILNGGGNNDDLTGGDGSDTLDGGSGNDTAHYSEKSVSVVVTLNGANFADVEVDGAVEDTIRNVENIVGGGGNDILTGDSLANIFTGRGGQDLLDGGAGNDTADYSEKTLAVSLTLTGATNAAVKVGGSAEDTIRNIENIIGGSGGDTLYGDSEANSFTGGIGNDTLRGGDGVDTLDGGADADTVLFSDQTASVVLTLNGAITAQATIGGVADDFVRNIENVVGGSGDDILVGDNSGNVLTGGGGNDRLTGGLGPDVLDGGTGIDTAVFSEKTGNLVFILNGSGVAVTKVGGLVEDTLRNIENVIGGSGADTMTGDGLANRFTGGLGADTLDGAGGIDTLDFGDKTLAVVGTLNGATFTSFTVGGLAEDSVRNFENVVGGSGNDALTGDAQDNVLEGGLGDDTLAGMAGADTLDGGGGSDTASYADKAVSVVVTLDGATDADVTVGGAVEDTIRNIENIIGGSAADTLTGDGADNTLSGGAGNDMLIGDAGADTLDGGADSDTADYSAETLAVSVTLNEASDVVLSIGGVADDTLRNVENIIGGSGNDVLVGDDFDNTLVGGLGDDSFTGGAGKDTIEGGAGSDQAIYTDKTQAVVVTLNGATPVVVTVNGVAEDTISEVEHLIGGSAGDTLVGDAEDNSFSGRGGNDVMDGGAGNDTALYIEKSGAVVVTLNGASDADVSVGGSNEDTIRNFENVAGGTGNDSLTGDGLANFLRGNNGNDTLKGMGGIDELDGGAGTDTADFGDKTTAVVVTLNGASNVTATVGGVADDTLRNIENVWGGTAGDTLTGDSQANSFIGWGGADTLNGADGNDTLRGGDGNDTLDGGTGSDTATYADKTTSVVVTLNLSTNVSVTVGGVAEDTIRNIESIVGGTGDDTFVGDSADNTFNGGSGNDLLRGGTGDDTLDGDGGTDTADFSDKSTAVVLTLNGASNATATIGGVAEDTVREVENVIGGTAGDTLYGDSAANVLEGRAGDDTLQGGGGNDTLDGGANIDTADYSDKSASVVLTLNGATNATATVGGVAEDTVRNIENVTGGSGNDTLVGDSGANLLQGGLGNDTLRGAGGNDTLDGGGGADTADYLDKTASVVLTLNGSNDITVTVGGVSEDTLRNIEHVIGGDGNDTLTGDGSANILEGSNGNDTLRGAGGNDTLDGASGIDTADFGDKTVSVVLTLAGGSNATATIGGLAEDTVRNIENVIGGTGDDTLTGDSLANTLTGGGGNDTLRGGTNNDTLDGGAGTGDTADFGDKTGAVVLTLNGATNATATVGGVAEDTVRNIENIIGGTGNDTLTGDGVANRLTGGLGNDTLSGNAGADIFVLGGGNDSVTGGSELDQFVFLAGALGTAATSTVTVSDFNRALGEVFDLSAIDAITGGSDDLFSFIGIAAFSGTAGELRWTDQGATRLIQGDVNGDSTADLTIVTNAAGPVAVDWFTL